MKRLLLLTLIPISMTLAHERSPQEQEKDMTFKQVMQLVNSAAIKILQGFLFNNDEMIKQGATEINAHPLPKGGVLRYIRPEKREEFAKMMPSFEKAVHGSAEDIVKYIEAGDKAKAYESYTFMIQGCMKCHFLFRDYLEGKKD